jgi:sigma-B regulation protein RsbU (phosphoserine phosphatase)
VLAEVLERVIKKYTMKLSEFVGCQFAIIDDGGRVISMSPGFVSSRDSLKFEVKSGYGKYFLLVNPVEGGERELRFLQFFYQELLNYEGHIENLVSELAQRYEELTIIYDMVERVGLIFDEGEILRVVFDKIDEIFDPEISVILIWEGGRPGRRYRRLDMEIDEDRLNETVDNLIGRAVESKGFLISSGSFGSMLAVPMFSGENLIGGIFISRGGDGEFKAGDGKLLLTLANYVGITIYRNRIIEEIRKAEALQRELEIAQRIQKGLLPREIPRFENLQISAFIQTSSNIGGDYYDFIISGERRSFLIADVSGHGVSAALMLSALRSVIKAQYGIYTDLSKFMSSINRIIYPDTADVGMYSTFFIGDYFPNSGRVVYSNAGHIPPLFFRSSEGVLHELEIHGAPIGLFEDEVYSTGEIFLSSGDILILYTDGITETQNSRGEFFELEKLKEIVVENSDKSADDICNVIIGEVQSFRGDVPQRDDITLLILKRIS